MLPPYATLGQKREFCLQRYGTPQNFQSLFCASKVAAYAKHPVKCVMGTAPQLYTLADAYGEPFPIQWLATLFVGVSEFSGAKEKISPYQLQRLAEMFYNRYSDLKATEVMLFIEKLSAGDYGRFAWHSFDPVAVLEYAQHFRDYRNNIEEKERQRIHMEQEREHDKRVAASPRRNMHDFFDDVYRKMGVPGMIHFNENEKQ